MRRKINVLPLVNIPQKNGFSVSNSGMLIIFGFITNLFI